MKFEELEKKLRNAMLKLKWLAAEQSEEHQETEEHNEDQSTSETQHDHTETTTPSRKRPARQPQARKLQALGQRHVIVDNEQDSAILFSNLSNFNIGILLV